MEAALTVAPGGTLMFTEGASLLISATGSLTADGTVSAPIVSAGEAAAPGHWKGISFEDTDSASNLLNHVTIEYGGYPCWYRADGMSNLMVSYATVSVSNSTIQNSGGWGIYDYFGSVTLDNITYQNNQNGDHFQAQ